MRQDTHYPDWLPAVFEGLGLVVLRQAPQGKGWQPLGPLPEWFEPAFGPLIEGFPSRVPFLEDFLENAAAEATEGGAPVRSGLWTESSGEAYEASAWMSKESLCVCVERAGARLAREQRFAQRLHEDALEKRRLAREIEKKELLLDCIVHDLSGPLGTILMNLRQMSRQVDREDLRRGLNRAIGQAERQRALIHCIGEIFAMDLPVPMLARALHPEATAVAWRELALGLVEAHAAGARARGVSLIVTGEERWSAGETPQAARLLENLLSNAVRHSPVEGVVEIALGAMGEDQVWIEVRDQGPGVPESAKSRLFRPYVKNGPHGGQAGLGLYYCQLVASLWGGRIVYEDREGGGACFRVSLPQVESPEKEGAAWA